MSDASKVVVHHLNNSRSQRVLFLLEELGVPYEVKRYARDAETMLAPAELKKVHPLGKSPVVTHGENTLAESGAILEYILNTFGEGRLVPKEGTKERLLFTFYMHYAEGSVMPPLLLKLIFDRVESAPVPFFVKPIAKGISKKVKAAFISPQINTHFDFMESELEKRAWFAGDDFTAADIQMSFPLEAASQRGGVDATRPKLVSFVKRIHERPAYKRALEAGGPYDFAKD